MPQLPSGRHAAFSPDPLARVAEDARRGLFVHRVMQMAQLADLEPYLEVLELVEIDGENEVVVSQGSNRLPGNFRSVPTGIRLNRLDDLPWPAEDIAAMREFATSERNVGWMQGLLADMIATQKDITQQGEFVARLQALWWNAGVHPAQEEGWSDDDSLEWDDYDLWAALACLHGGLAMRERELDSGALDAFHVTGATLSQLASVLPPKASGLLQTEAGVRETGALLRQADALGDVSEDRREWQHRQFLACAEAMGNAIDGSVLRDIDREAANIVALAFVTS